MDGTALREAVVVGLADRLCAALRAASVRLTVRQLLGSPHVAHSGPHRGRHRNRGPVSDPLESSSHLSVHRPVTFVRVVHRSRRAWCRGGRSVEADGMPGHVIGVLGASGGVGATTVAAHLAWRSPAPVTVLADAAPTGRGALDVHVGIDHLPGPRWPAFSRLRGAADGAAVTTALPRTSRYAVLSGSSAAPAPPATVTRAVLVGLADHADLLVLDLGSGLLSVQPALDLCTTVVVVAGLGVRRLADLDQVAADLHRRADLSAAGEVVLLTRGSRRLTDVADEVSLHVDLPLLGHWADEPRVAADLERGIPPGEHTHGLDALADRLLHPVASTVRSSA